RSEICSSTSFMAMSNCDRRYQHSEIEAAIPSVGVKLRAWILVKMQRSDAGPCWEGGRPGLRVGFADDLRGSQAAHRRLRGGTNLWISRQRKLRCGLRLTAWEPSRCPPMSIGEPKRRGR